MRGETTKKNVKDRVVKKEKEHPSNLGREEYEEEDKSPAKRTAFCH